MHLEIVTPEKVVLSQDNIKDVKVPGVSGEFQLLDNHAPIVSTLQEGNIILDDSATIPKSSSNLFQKKNGKFYYSIKGGVVENKENKTIILVD